MSERSGYATIRSRVDFPLARGLAFIFDMDGVIVDSNPVHRRAWVEFNRRYGLETGESMHRRMYGKRNDQILRDFFGTQLSDSEILARGAAKEELYRELMAACLEQSLVPGIREFLARAAGLPLALATNANSSNVDFLLDRTGLRRYFQVVVDGYQVSNPKPHPEIYLVAARRLGMEPRNCIVFEDSHSGVQAACAAGMRTVGVTTTHATLPGADLMVGNFLSAELEAWLRNQSPLA